jgi:hypothetical protein
MALNNVQQVFADQQAHKRAVWDGIKIDNRQMDRSIAKGAVVGTCAALGITYPPVAVPPAGATGTTAPPDESGTPAP